MKNQNKNNPFKEIQDFMTSGYEDYIASRFLLNNGYYLQGGILASMAVEKYLKATIKAYFPEEKVPHKHLDNLHLLVKRFSNTEHEKIYQQHDQTFMAELSTLYMLRYFNNFSENVSIGFLVNQFLCELDHMVAFYNHYIKLHDADGSVRETSFSSDAKQSHQDLLENNWPLIGIDKNEAMNRETHGFSYYYHPERNPVELKTNRKVVPGKATMMQTHEIEIPLYTGQILQFRMKHKKDT